MNARVEWLWSTPVIVEDIGTRVTVGDFALLAECADEERLSKLAEVGLFADLERELHDGKSLKWRVSAHSLESGEYLSPSISRANLRAYLIISQTNSGRYEGSGSLTLFDPRAGIQNIFVPGMPWNKSVSLQGEVGRLIAAPGWVSAMVTPVGEGENLIFLCLEGDP